MQTRVRVGGRWLVGHEAPTWSTIWPGGSDVATVAVDQIPAWVRTGQVFELVEHGRVLWVGILKRPEGGTTLTAEGLHRAGEDHAALDSADEMTLVPDVAITQAIARGLPWVLPTGGISTDPVAIEAAGPLSVAALLDAYCEIEGLHWGIDPQTRTVVTRPRESTGPDWHVTPGLSGLSMDTDAFASTLIGRYVDAEGVYKTAIAERTPDGSRWDAVVKDRLVPDLLSEGAALAEGEAVGILQSELADRNRPAWSAPVVIAEGELAGNLQQPVRLSSAAAGDVVRIHGLVEDVADLAGRTWVDMRVGKIDHDGDGIVLTALNAAETFEDALSRTPSVPSPKAVTEAVIPAARAGMTPLEVHNQAVADIEAEISDVYTAVANGDTENAQAIAAAVSDFNDLAATVIPAPIVSPNPPGSTAGVYGQTYYQHKPGDTETIVAQYRSLGGTTWAPVALDAVMIPKIDIGVGTVGTLGVERLIVADLTNMVKNPNFATGAEMWVQSEGISNFITGTAGVLVSASTFARWAGGSPESKGIWPASQLPVTPGQGYHFSAEMLRSNNAFGTGSPGTGEFQMRVNWYDKAGSLITSQVLAIQPAGSPTVVSAAVKAPPTAVTCLPTFTAINMPPQDLAGVTSVRVRKAAGGELIVDGAVSANHFNADTFTGAIMTGAVMQTNANGPWYGTTPTGVKWTNGGIVLYSPSGEAMTVLSSSTGLISAKGDIQTVGGTGGTAVKMGTYANPAVGITQGLLEFHGDTWLPGRLFAQFWSVSGTGWSAMRMHSPYKSGMNAITQTAYVDVRMDQSGNTALLAHAKEARFTANSFLFSSGDSSTLDFTLNHASRSVFSFRAAAISTPNALDLSFGETVGLAVGQVNTIKSLSLTSAARWLQLQGARIILNATDASGEDVFVGKPAASINPFVGTNHVGLRYGSNKNLYVEDPNGASQQISAFNVALVSDPAAKEAVEQVEPVGVLDRVRATKVYAYSPKGTAEFLEKGLISEEAAARRYLGLLSDQALIETLPEVAVTPTDEDDRPEQHIDVYAYISTMHLAIQEHADQTDELRALTQAQAAQIEELRELVLTLTTPPPTEETP